jgi:hypothetical protein
LQKKIEKINKRRISQSALGQKEFEPINECQTVKIDLKINIAVNGFLKRTPCFILIGRAVV